MTSEPEPVGGYTFMPGPSGDDDTAALNAALRLALRHRRDVEDPPRLPWWQRLFRR